LGGEVSTLCSVFLNGSQISEVVRPDCQLCLAKAMLLVHAAFDKGDLLYLRDEEEKRRFTEMELRDSERQQFSKERARVEAERAAAALRAAQARKDKANRYPHHSSTLAVTLQAVSTLVVLSYNVPSCLSPSLPICWHTIKLEQSKSSVCAEQRQNPASTV